MQVFGGQLTLFTYFVPQEQGLTWQAHWAWKNMGNSIVHPENTNISQSNRLDYYNGLVFACFTFITFSLYLFLLFFTFAFLLDLTPIIITRPPSTTIPEARKLKNDLRKKSKRRDATDEDRENFHRALRTLSFLLRKEKEKKNKSDARKQESDYKKDFFKFAKTAANGRLDKGDEVPTFSKEDADDFYKGRYSQAVDIDISQLDWFSEVAPPTVPYDTSPITPKEVKAIFRSKSPTTAPGEDGLLYGVLAKLPAVHHFLATHYNKTQASSLAPKVWAGSIVKLCPGSFQLPR